MNIQTQQCGAVSLLKHEGPLTGDKAQEFKSELIEAIRKSLGRVVVDMSAVTYVDSQGLESLVEVTESLARSGKTLKLCSVNDTLREVLELTGVSPQFEQYEDANAAVRSFL